MTPELSRVLKHELTHSFVGQKTRGHAPTWIQEGLAQWMEGKRSGDSANVWHRLMRKAMRLRWALWKDHGWDLPNDAGGVRVCVGAGEY